VGFIGGTHSLEMRQVGLAMTRRVVGAGHPERLQLVEGSHLFPMEKPRRGGRRRGNDPGAGALNIRAPAADAFPSTGPSMATRTPRTAAAHPAAPTPPARAAGVVTLEQVALQAGV
jgi:hypothetical protein